MDLLLFTLTFTLSIALSSSKDPLEYFLLEELPQETLIGNVVVDAGLQSDYPNDTSVQFSILRQANSHDYLFDIDGSSGVIRTTEVIDRDTLCPSQDGCHVWLHVAIRHGFSFKMIKVMVNILDTNDHRPSFPESSVDLQIPESTFPGTSFALPVASDLDSANNAIQTYDITSETFYFELEVAQNDLDGSTDLKLVLLKQLDREDQQTHSLVLTAFDGGIPHKTGTLIVNIQVEDSNDNHPMFSDATYDFKVVENDRPSQIGEVKALDKDVGKNGQIVYKLSVASEIAYGTLFEVKNSTGQVLTKRKLDHEEKDMYVLTIEASDLGSNQKKGKCTVVVKVEDINDNAPFINLNTLTDGDTAAVLENSPTGTFVAHMSVADMDAGRNGKVECIVNDPNFKLDEIYSGQFKVITAADLDRESVKQFTVPLACLDQGTPPNVAAVNLTINVMDVNDNAPQFEKNIYHVNIKENNELDAIILDVKATDLDQDKNAAVRYSLLSDGQSDASKLFNIHPLTGQISTNAIFDYEVLQEVKFKVTASDEGQPPLSATTTVVLNIINVNDEPPQFIKESYDFGTFENQPQGTEVGSVIATDADGLDDLYYEVTFYDDAITEKTFVVDSQSGRILTTTTLDREERSRYFLVITARSDTYPPMSATVNVTIHVADTNDNIPVIGFPNLQNDTMEISAYESVGTKIAKVFASDDDIGTNAKLWYFIDGGDDQKYFKIDPISGSVSIQNDISDLTGQTKHLSIKVEDSGHPVQRSSAILKVIIQGQTNGLKLTSTMAKNSSSTVITLSIVSVLVILTLLTGLILMWRKGIFQFSSRSKKTDEGQTQQTSTKPGETQQMLSSFHMISFLKDNEINNKKNTLNSQNVFNNTRHSIPLNNAVEQQRQSQTPQRQFCCDDPSQSSELGPVSHIVHIDTLPGQGFSSYMTPDLPATESTYDEIPATERDTEQESVA